MELHVVIRATNVPAGNITQPTHPVAWRCVCVCVIHVHCCAQDNTEAASVRSAFAVQEGFKWNFFFFADFQERKREE